MKAFNWYKKAVWDRLQQRRMEEARGRLKNRDFTIIASNCVAGVMYHLLGLRFDSPTINIWMDKKEFCRFASDLPWYMSQELRFYDKPDRNCPCAYIGEGDREITVVFVHYKTEEEARTKWEERKLRIHWDNLYIVTCDGNNVSEEDFALLKKASCKRKIIFTSHEHPEIEDSFVLHAMRKYPTAARMQITRNKLTGLRSWERDFDYVAWLNGEATFRKK